MPAAGYVTSRETNLDAFDLEKLYSFYGYEPHKGQRLFHASRAKIRIACCAARWGKSLAGGFEAAKFMLIPDCKVAFYAPSYSLAKRGEWAWFLKMMQHAHLLEQATRFVDPSVGESYVAFPWGSELKIRSCDNKKSLLGEEIDVAILCEAAQMNREHLERYIIPRVTARNGYMILPSTPAGKGTWYEEYFERGLSPEENEGWESFQFGILGEYGNPYIDESQVEWARQNTSKEFFEENYLGRFTTRKGAVYKDFGEHNIIDVMPKGWQSWRVIVGIDFGYRNPTAAVFIAIDPTGPDYYVFDEIYQTELLTPDLAAGILKKERGFTVLARIADHDAQDRGLLAKMGVITRPCIKNDKNLVGPRQRKGLLLGIETVAGLLKVKSHGRPNLYVLRKCSNVIKEFQGYCWPEDRGEDTGKAEQDYPLDQYSHSMDAIRYAIYWTEKQVFGKRKRDHQREHSYQAPGLNLDVLGGRRKESVKFNGGNYQWES